MKHKGMRLACCILLLGIILSLPVSATQKITLQDHAMSLNLSDDFTVLSRENVAEYKDLLTQYETTVTDTQVKLEKENYLVLALSQSMNCTVFLSSAEDQVSATIGDLITYPDPETAKNLLLGKTLPDTMEVRELEQRGALFFRVDFGVENNVGRIAYVTVMNGKWYTLCLINNNGAPGENTTTMFDTVFSTWEYTIHAETLKIQEFRNQITTVFFWICIPIGLVVMGVIIRLLIKDIRNREQNRKRKENTPKKPRR